ncbi:MAG TPA: hypothetical protein VK469_16895 [Candidatus Kapabacteria bacterium]|nr:hypothetical protein [Candidatus Kapabacteria bacterium]
MGKRKNSSDSISSACKNVIAGRSGNSRTTLMHIDLNSLEPILVKVKLPRLTKVKDKDGLESYAALTGSKRKILSYNVTGMFSKSEIKKAVQKVIRDRSLS